MFSSFLSKKLRAPLFAGFSVISLTHCTPSFQGEYSDPAKEEIVDDRWNETDSRKTAKEMMTSALSKAWLKNHRATKPGKKPVVIVDDVENRTDEHLDTKALTEFIRNELLNSGEIRFADNKNREKVLKEINYQGGGAVAPDQAKKLGKQLGADFMLSGAMSSIVATQAELKTVTYQTNLTLTNLETTEIEWSENYQIKKRFKRKGAGW